MFYHHHAISCSPVLDCAINRQKSFHIVLHQSHTVSLMPEQISWHLADDQLNRSALVQVLTWHQTCENPLLASMITQFTYAYMHHQAPVPLTIFRSNSTKIRSALVWNMLYRSQRNFAHVTTGTLSWRVQNFVLIGGVHFKPEHCKLWSNFEFDRNIVSGTGTRP